MFIDNGDGTVTDTITSLVWQQDTAPGTYEWEDALKYCEDLDLAGHTDWRLPTLRELLSIVDYGLCDPAVDPVFWTVPSYYWSSSAHVGYSHSAWHVSFVYGGVSDGSKVIRKYVRAVRGGKVNDHA